MTRERVQDQREVVCEIAKVARLLNISIGFASAWGQASGRESIKGEFSSREQ